MTALVVALWPAAFALAVILAYRAGMRVLSFYESQAGARQPVAKHLAALAALDSRFAALEAKVRGESNMQAFVPAPKPKGLW